MTANTPSEYSMPHPTIHETLEYNSTRATLKLPEYGRLVQDMIEYAITIKNKEERQQYAEAIANVMIGLNPKMKDVPDYQHKIWDHLAYIANYQLDINYPFEITEHKGKRVKPEKLSYPKGNIRFRHYGRLLERAISQLKQTADGPERAELIRLIANRMKRNLADWKGDGIQDSKVARDISFYTEGEIQPDFSTPGNELMQIGENRFRARKNKGMF